MHVSLETPDQTDQRLTRVIAAAELRVYPGLYGYREFPLATFPAALAAHALAFVRDEQVWSVLGPATPDVLEPLRVFCFHFPLELDNSGFVGWLATHLKTKLGTGVVVVCGYQRERGGVFDYWGVPAAVAEEVWAEVYRLRSQVGGMSIRPAVVRR